MASYNVLRGVYHKFLRTQHKVFTKKSQRDMAFTAPKNLKKGLALNAFKSAWLRNFLLFLTL